MGEGRCEKIELAFIQRVPPFPRGDYRGVAGCLFQALIQQRIPPPSSPPLEKGGQPNVAVLIIDKHIFSQLQGLGGEGDCRTATACVCLSASGALLQPLLELDAACIAPLTPSPSPSLGRGEPRSFNFFTPSGAGG
jgi:hypothetical protein